MSKERSEAKVSHSSHKDSVIVNINLTDSDLMQFLSVKFRIRESDKTIQDSCIFPKAGIAFLLLDLCKVSDEKCEILPEILERLQKFDKVHAKGIVILYSNLIDQAKQTFIFDLQMKYIKSDLSFLPAHNFHEVMDIITTQIQALQDKESEVKATIKHQRTALCSEDVMVNVLQSLNISPQESGLLLDGLRCLSGVMNASHQQLTDCSLDSMTAQCILHQINKDTVML